MKEKKDRIERVRRKKLEWQANLSLKEVICELVGDAI